MAKERDGEGTGMETAGRRSGGLAGSTDPAGSNGSVDAFDPVGAAGGRGVDARPAGSSRDRVFGAVAALALVLAVAFAGRMMLGAPDDGASGNVAAIQPLRIVRPAEGDDVGSPVELVIGTAAALRPSPMGWTAAGRHLHLRAGDAEVMAGNADLAPAGAGRWRWRVPLPPGERTLRVYWAGPDHRPIEAGASPEVHVRVR
ncbi:MAG: hypothetical protein JWM27_1531 [Gemmatimonadetes bacterium]|nr:hypothetical protein [Gemmatimonadota bacterium]